MEKRRLLAVFVVDTTADSGAGSLRSAIESANSASGADTIAFDISSLEGAGPHTIAPLSALPTITETVTIDGYTETGASANTLAVSNDAVLQIVLDGTGAGAVDGLVVSGSGATGSEIRGLVIGNFRAGIRLDSTSAVTVAGNFLGTDVSGTLSAGNTGSGIEISAASANLIGGSSPADRNVISGNTGDGVLLIGSGTDDNVVSGNYIGTDLSGTVAVGNDGRGVQISGGASGNFIGTDGDAADDASEGNLISGNALTGIRIDGLGTDDNTVAGNFIGTDVTGEHAIANGTPGVTASWGVFVTNDASNTIIGTHGDGVSDAVEGNLISGNVSDGVKLQNRATGTVVAGNLIGTNKDGTLPLGNQRFGIFIQEADANRIGTNGDGVSDMIERNVIAANAGNGVYLTGVGTHHNSVAGNFIGTDITGAVGLGNGGYGVRVVGGAHANFIGTNGDGVGDSSEGNLISGNSLTGVRIEGIGTDDNQVAGNFIGTDVTGEVAIGNGTVGVFDSWGVLVYADAAGTVIGTDGDGVSDALEGNLISGNISEGVYLLDRVASTVVAGNLIGTNQDGTSAIGNQRRGILIQRAAGIRVGTNGDGTSDVLERNVVSGNAIHGVQINGVGADQNWVAGNYIGTDVTGTVDLGNASVGLVVNGGASENLIGTNSDGSGDELERNVISGNDSIGVTVSGNGTNHNVIAGNYIGTDATGTAAIQNFSHSINVDGADDTRIGTDGDGVADAAERNVISGNRYSLVVQRSTTERTIIAGNYIGTNAAGDAAIPNGSGIELRWGAKDTRIGTDGSNDAFNQNERNVISGNNYRGIRIQTPQWNSQLPTDGSTTDGTVVAGNFIGLSASGTAKLSNGNAGIFASDQVTNLRIGTNGDGIADEVERNVISGNTGSGVEINGWSLMNLTTSDYIIAGDVPRATVSDTYSQVDIYDSGNQGSWGFNNPMPGGGGDFYVVQATGTLQVNAAGTYSFSLGSDNGGRLRVDGTDVIVNDLGNRPFAENFGSITLSPGSHSFEMVGYEQNGGASFEVSVAVGSGVTSPVTAANGWQVLGSPTPHSQIALSGTVATTVYYPDPVDMQSTIAGNYIGTDVTGTVDLGNDQRGILLTNGVKGVTIGTDGNGLADAAERNIVSGNDLEGVRIQGRYTADNVVAGNYIGTDVTGNVAIENYEGVELNVFTSNNRLGTNADGIADAAERNIISGNTENGIVVNRSSRNKIAGNYVGTDVTGTQPISNGRNRGIAIVVNGASQENVIGTDGDGVGDAVEGNLVSGNDAWVGVYLAGAGTSHNIVAGNLIGTDVTGTVDLGNWANGIEIKDDASENLIGTNADGVSDRA